MIFLQALLALLAQAAGRILNTAFGWAMVVLFGKVPANKQLLLSLISMTSVVWVLTVVGVLFPRAGSWMIGFIRIPSYVDTTPIRLGMLPFAILLPGLVGFWNYLLTNKEQRSSAHKTIAEEILRGYPFTLGLSVTFVVMLFVVPLMKLHEAVRKYHAHHIPVMIKPNEYMGVVQELTELLQAKGLNVVQVQASRLVRWPTKLLSLFAVSSVSMFVANELMELHWDGGEIVVHPSDLVIRGRAEFVSKVYGWIISDLALKSAYFTWHDEAHQIEDKLRKIRQSVEANSTIANLSLMSARIHELDHELHALYIPEDEWSVLFREQLQVKTRIFELQCAIARINEKDLVSDHRNVSEQQIPLWERHAS